MIQIYGCAISQRTNRVRYLLNALEMDYEYKFLDAFAGESQQPWYLENFHPAGKFPVMVDGDLTIFESCAIMRYLCSKTENSFYSAEPRNRAIIDQWTDYVGYHVEIHLVKIFFNRILGFGVPGYERDHRSEKESLDWIPRFFSPVETQLSKTPYLAGNGITIPDFALVSAIDCCEAINLSLDDYPMIKRHYDELTSAKWYTDVFDEYIDCLGDFREPLNALGVYRDVYKHEVGGKIVAIE